MAVVDEYAHFVTHPRYGRRPRFTGLNPDTDFQAGVFLHWHTPRDCRIPNTAVPADLSRQSPATVPVTHYFDAKRKCRDCARPFIFFADEQKYWYEELGFALEADCVRCVACRKKEQGLEQKRERYEALFHISERSTDENLEMVDCCLALVASGVFHKRKLQHMRMILKKLPSELKGDTRARAEALWTRLLTLENKGS